MKLNNLRPKKNQKIRRNLGEISIPLRTKHFIREASILSGTPNFNESSQSSSRVQNHQATQISPTTPTPSDHHQPIFLHSFSLPYLSPSAKQEQFPNPTTTKSGYYKAFPIYFPPSSKSTSEESSSEKSDEVPHTKVNPGRFSRWLFISESPIQPSATRRDPYNFTSRQQTQPSSHDYRNILCQVLNEKSILNTPPINITIRKVPIQAQPSPNQIQV
ncbi:hypothetical protein O181_016915 [Austropuccinia psidii MF-1]|uniref:Uncharacterized protein n=1 Tax=Austropuccinia psidii MF-1 TaxID=1389203 RepID=A0A9Q3C5U5_9BASI|nr:hypothetical protein [Austropuccinia psidii MF-1]